MDSGFAGGEDEVYNVYDKPWRQDKDLAGNLYRPSKNLEKDVYGDDLDKLIKANRCVTVTDSIPSDFGMNSSPKEYISVHNWRAKSILICLFEKS